MDNNSDVELSCSTDKTDQQYDDLLYNMESSFQTRMGGDIDPFAFKADAENYLHCEVREVYDIYAYIQLVPWYDVKNPALRRLINSFGSDSDQQRLQRFEEHRDKYFLNQNRLRIVPKPHRLYHQLRLNPEATLFLFLVDSRWDRICCNSWLFGIHDYITKLILEQRGISLCDVYFCTVAKASSIMPL